MPLTPLIEASAAYPAMERLVISAKHSVWLGFRIFDPATRLRSDEARALGLQSWSDLASWSCAQGVSWHVRLTDFDPIGAPDLHELCWRSVRAFQQVQRDHPGSMHILPALHDHEIGLFARFAFWRLAQQRLKRHLKAMQQDGLDQAALARDRPGLMRWLESADQHLKIKKRWSPFAIHPVVHHEKLMIVDQSRMILGGLDVNERRFDDHDHDRPADDTWHDVSVQVEGEETLQAVTAASRHYIAMWNKSRASLSAQSLSNEVGDVEALADPPKADLPPADPDQAGSQQSVRFLRTVSKPSGGFFRIGPNTVCKELEAAYLDLISQAQKLLYIETQYLRSRTIAEGLAARAAQNPDLHLVVVLPAAPDDVAFEGNTGPDARHGAWLQARSVESVMKAFGKRAVFLSLVGDKHPETASTEISDMAYVAGQPLVYVHSKVMIADGAAAIIASSNLNGRSMGWDTESGILWHDSRAVTSFQQDLWATHFKGHNVPVGTNDDVGDILQAFVQGASPLSDTFLSPYPHTRAKRFATSHFYVPDKMV